MAETVDQKEPLWRSKKGLTMLERGAIQEENSGQKASVERTGTWMEGNWAGKGQFGAEVKRTTEDETTMYDQLSTKIRAVVNA